MKEKKKFKIKKLFKNSIFTFILGIFLASVIGVSAASVLYSSDVTYDNSSSGLSSTTVQDALDELYEQAKNAPSCDSEGNCTVECPSDKPKYVATSTGYKCTAGFIGTVYACNEDSVTIGTSTLSDLGTSYATFAEAAASNSKSNGIVALKYTVDNDVLTEGYVCFLKAGTEYCLKGNDTYANNVAILKTAFPSCGASASGSSANCHGDSVDAYATSSGVSVLSSYSSSWHCYANSDGDAGCGY